MCMYIGLSSVGYASTHAYATATIHYLLIVPTTVQWDIELSVGCTHHSTVGQLVIDCTHYGTVGQAVIC